MKLFPLLLSGALLLPGTAFANNGVGHGQSDDYGDGRGASCERGNASFCGGDSGGDGGQGGSGGHGGAGGNGGAGGDVRNSGNSRNSNRNSNRNNNNNSARGGDQSQSQSNSQSQSSSSTSSADNNGNHQNVNIEGDEREVPIAPLPTTDSVGAIGDVLVPLPHVGLGGFTSTQPNGELDYGVSIGVRVPLGTGAFRAAAEAEAQRRADRGQFTLIQEAIYLRDQGVLDREVHARHWQALYGTK